MIAGESCTFAPDGWDVQWTSWGAPDWLSLSMKVIVLFTPTTTVKVEGWKFRLWSVPTF
jgi:hypothetical protein